MEKAIAILAAGIGSRYGGFKQMDPVGPNGDFIIDYSVYDAIRTGFNKVVFIIQHSIEQEFKATIGNRIMNYVETFYSFQELEDLPEGIEINPERTKPWGTVQAVLTCANLINSPFAVINADDFYGKESYKKLSQFLDTVSPDRNDYSMVGFRLSNTLSKHGGVTRGICKSRKNDLLDSIVEISGISCRNGQIYFEDSDGNKNELNKDDLISMNMWGFTPSILGPLAEEFQIFLKSYAKDLKRELVIPTAVNSLITKGKASVKVLSTSSSWFGITYPSDKEEVKARINQLIQLGEYPDNLWK
ncbi:MAG: sugar phosphate nucleotidyltransferase [Planctomycetota bacterium]|nr:sugar phosphate nucleotidyltransferase [Planctomycetota bacterium]